MATSADGSAEAPREGYYPDPSIPGYVRYWNGTAWVPGTSRPQPGPGEEPPPPPGSRVAPPAAPVPPPASAPEPARSAPASVEESGAMFLDEDPAAPVAQQGPPTHVPQAHVPQARVPQAPAPHAPAPEAAAPQPSAAQPSAAQPSAAQHPSAQPHPAPAPFQPPAQAAPPPVPQESGYGYPRTAPPAAPSAAGGYGYPERQLPAAPGGYGYPNGAQPAHGEGGRGAGGGVPWQRQVSELARVDGPVAAPGGRTPDPVMPWRPLASDPFAQAAQPAKPGGTGRRLAARVVDTVLVGAAVSAATYPLAMGSVRHIQHKIDAARLSGENVRVWLIDGTTGTYLGVLLAGMLLAGLLYEVLPTAKWGRTLGKKLFRLQVLDIESQITPGFGQALRRMLLRQVLDFLGVGVVNVAWCLFDRPWRQCWHDKAARTFVASDN